MDVVVGTPGRVMDLMDRRVLDLSNVSRLLFITCSCKSRSENA